MNEHYYGAAVCLSSVDRSFPAKVEPAILRIYGRTICGCRRRRVFYRARVKSFYSFPALPQKRNRCAQFARPGTIGQGNGSTNSLTNSRKPYFCSLGKEVNQIIPSLFMFKKGAEKHPVGDFSDINVYDGDVALSPSFFLFDSAVGPLSMLGALSLAP